MKDKKEFNEEDNNHKFQLKEIITNKRYYAIANLAFYSIIIIILIIMARSTPSTDVNSTNKNNNRDVVSEISGFDYIKGKNFKFIYTLDIDGKKTIYEGKQFDNKLLFVDKNINQEYYVDGNVSLIKEKDNYIYKKIDNNYFNYLDVDLIEKILSNVSYDDGDCFINLSKLYELTGKTIENIEEDDAIHISIEKSNNIITKIDFDLSDYSLKLDENIKKSKLTLEYFDFNLVEDFKIEQK